MATAATEQKLHFMMRNAEKTNLSGCGDSSLDKSGISDEALKLFSWINFTVICLGIDVFGMVTNIINIICFVKQGFQDSINVSLLALSVSDLCCLVTLSFNNIALTPAVVEADLQFDPVEVVYLAATTPHFSFCRVTSWITAFITLERCLCVIVPLKVKNMFAPKRTAVIITSTSTILLFSAAPVYAVNKLEMKFSQLRNKTILGLVFSYRRDYVQSINFIVNNFLLPLTAFVVIVICTVILVIKLQSTNTWRERSVAPSRADRVSSRNKKVARMVVMISTLFIVCFVPMSITLFVVAFEPSLSYGGKYLKIGILISGSCFSLESINSSMNIFIYYYMSSKYRDVIRQIFCRALPTKSLLPQQKKTALK